MELFSAPTSPTQNLFEAPVDAPVANPYTEQTQDNTAFLGGLALQRLDHSTGKPLPAYLDQAKALIDTGKELKLRSGIAMTKDAQERQYLQQVQQEALKGGNSAPLGPLIERELSKTRSDPGHTLEQEGISEIQDQAAADPNQAWLMTSMANGGSALDRTRDHATKLMLYNREMSSVDKQRQDQGFWGNVSDYFSIPLHGQWHKLQALPGVGSWMNPGAKLNSEINTLWDPSVSVNEFATSTLPEFMRHVKNSSGLFAENLSMTASTMNQMYGLKPGDVQEMYATGALDIGLTFPGLTARVALSPFKLGMMLGNRAGVAEGAAMTILSDAAKVEHPAAGMFRGTDAIDESFPSTFDTTLSKVSPYVKPNSDIVTKIQEMQEKAAAVKIIRAARLEPAQEAEAIAKFSKTIETRYNGDNVVDIQAGPITGPRSALTIADEHAQQVHDIETAGLSATPPPKEGMVRFYHGGSPPTQEGETRWVSPDKEYAKNYRSNGKPNDVFYVDVPKGHAEEVKARLWDEVDEAGQTGIVGRYRSTKLPAELAKKLKPVVETPTPEISAATRNFKSLLPWTERLQSVKDEETGVHSLIVSLGRKTGTGGYVTEAGAKSGATLRGLADYKIVKNADGQHFIQVKHDVPETMVSEPFLTDENMPRVWNWRRFTSSPNTFINDVINRNRSVQTFQKSRITEQLFKPILNNIHVLSTPEIKSLEKVLVNGEKDQKWYDLNELSTHWQRIHGSGITEKQALAYYSAKEANDQVWKLFNTNVYINKVRRGWVSGSAKNEATKFDTGQTNLREHPSPDFSKLKRVFDLEDGHTETDALRLQKKFDDGDYRVLELEQAYDYGDEPVKYVLAHKRSSVVSPLERVQMGYVSGGSRENVSHYFVKQAVRGTFQDGGKYYLNPKVHVAARTRVQAKEWADSMEKARGAFFSKTLSDNEKRAIIEQSPVETLEKWQHLVDSGEIRSDTPFEVLADQELPHEMSGLGEEVHHWYDKESTGMEQYYSSKGRMYYSKKGERLLDPDENLAQILDPFRTLYRAVQNASQAAAFHDYSTKVIEDWSRFVLKNGLVEDLKNLDPYNVFFHGTLKDQLWKSNKELYTKLDVTRKTHQRLMGMRSTQSSTVDQARLRFAEWAQTKGRGGRWASGVSLDTMARNPIHAINALVSDSFLGFYDPGQFLVQSQTAFAAIGTHPVWGAQAAAMTKPMFWMLHNRSENLLDHIATTTSKIHGLSPEEFKFSVKMLRDESGILNVSGEMAQIDRYMDTVGGNALVRNFNSFRQSGRMFLNKSEQFNRMTAFQIAWKDIRKQHPDLDYKSDLFRGLVIQKTDTLSGNMTTASRAFWQQGPLLIPTKFMAYQSRLLELMLPKRFGGSPVLRGEEKARLAISQLFMYGAKGLPGGGALARYANDQYSQATGQPLDPESWKVLSSGLWDTLAFNMSGGELDTDFSMRAATGAAWEQLWTSVSTGNRKSFLDIWSGATGEVTSNGVDAVNKLLLYFQAEQSIVPSADDWSLIGQDVAQQLAVTRRATKAYWIWKTGYLRDPNSGEHITKGTTLEGFAALLGIPLQEEAARFNLGNENKDRQQVIQDMGKLIANNRRLAIDAYTSGDEKKMSYYNKMAAGLMAAYRDDPVMSQNIAAEADKQFGYTGEQYNQTVQQHVKLFGYKPPGGSN